MQAHLVNDGARICDRVCGCVDVARAQAHPIQGIRDRAIDFGGLPEHVVDAFGSPDDIRKLTEELGLWVGFVGPVILARAFDTRSIAGPDLHLAVAGFYEQRVLGPAIGPQHRDRIRMVEAREVPEVAVLAKRKFGVSRAWNQARTPEDRDGVGAHRVAHSLSPLFEHPPILTRIFRAVPAGRRPSDFALF